MLSFLTGIPGETALYLSIDTVFEKDRIVQYWVEFLNTLYLPGVPPYKLDLKVGDPVDATAEFGSTSILLWHQTYSEGVKVKHSRSHRLHWMYQRDTALSALIPIIPSYLPCLPSSFHLKWLLPWPATRLNSSCQLLPEIKVVLTGSYPNKC